MSWKVLYIGFKLDLQKNLKSCHDFWHRDTIGLAVSKVVLRRKIVPRDLGNRDTIQLLPHQVSLERDYSQRLPRENRGTVGEIVTRFWAAVTSI